MLYAGYDEEKDVFVTLEGSLDAAKKNMHQALLLNRFYLVPNKEEAQEQFYMPTLNPVYIEISECDETLSQKIKELRSFVCLWDVRIS